MKRILSLLLSILITSSSLAIFAGAEKSDRSGIMLEYTSTKGSSHPSGYYLSNKKYEKMPVTFEAWVYIPKSVYSSRAGIILGNYQGFAKDDYINFEIHSNGVPRLAIGEPGGSMYDFKFTRAIIPADTWTHLAIVYGTGSNGQQLFCYLNGELKHKTHVKEWYDAPEAIFDNHLCLAGDYRPINEQGFRGILGDVAVYSDIRTDEEILADSKGTPDLSDSELMMYFELSDADSFKDVPDASGNGYDMRYYRMWLSEAEMEQIRAEDEHEYSYAIAFLPDIQYMTEKYPDSLKCIFDYLVSESKVKNIRYAIGLGDITNTNAPEEWETIVRQTNRLNGYLDYSLVCGNHDTLKNKRLEYFDLHYAVKTGYYYQHVAASGGFMDKDSVRNTYLTFSVGEIDYLIINLDFGVPDAVIKWAGSVLDAHPEHRAILVTHGYLNADGTTLDSNDYATPPSYDKTLNSGEQIWEKLVSRHENIDMMVSGHMHHDSIVCTPREGDAGNTVYQLLMDPQSTCNKLGGMGFIGLMYFTEDGNHARVEYYSTVLGKYFHESNKTVSLSFGNPEQEETISIETTPAPITDTPTEPVTNAPEEEKSGCGAILTISSAVLVILAAPFIFKSKKDN